MTREQKRRRFLANLPGIIGSILVAIVLISALAAPLIATQDPHQRTLQNRLLPPAWSADGTSEYILGTDAVGRDLYSRLIYGSQVSLLVGVAATAISMILGTVLGLLAGFYGGTVDRVVMWLTEVLMAFPFVLFALLVMAVFGGGLTKLVIVLAVAGWVGYARVIRGQVLSLRELEFIQASRAIGASDLRILLKYVFPNVLSSIIVLATLQVANNILMEAGLTYLGMGVDPNIPTWGGMLAEGRNYLERAWWVATFPGLAIMITVLGMNLVGDWLRDKFDPRMTS